MACEKLTENLTIIFIFILRLLEVNLYRFGIVVVFLGGKVVFDGFRDLYVKYEFRIAL